MRSIILLCCSVLLCIPIYSGAQDVKPVSITLDKFEYPYPVKYFPLTVEGKQLEMAYMDVPATGKSNGQTVVLMHGKNFGSFYWANTIQMLTGKGYRVIAVDQLGFGKSSRADLHYSLHLLAYNTHLLLDTLSVSEIILIGHSTGGMLASRYALLYPAQVKYLILEDPIGLEDYRQLVPYRTIDQLYQEELQTSDETTTNYLHAYFVKWKPEYEVFVEIMNGWKRSNDYAKQALCAATTTEMIYEQPVCYEFGFVKVPTLIIAGNQDRTVIEKAKVPKELLPKAGQFPQLAEKTAKAIPAGKYVIIDQCGHIPHLEQPEKFHRAILDFLK